MKDKIIFWIDADLIDFCLAYYIQNSYNAEYYAIVDVTNKQKKFFVKQQLVKFHKVWFVNDHVKINNQNVDLSYLSSFEEKYRINLWTLAINERLFYRFNKFHKFSTNQILSILEQECKLFEKVILEIKPNFLISHESFFHRDEIFQQLCKVFNVKKLIYYHLKFIYKCMISEEVNKPDFIENLNLIKGTNRNFEDLQSYLKTKSVFAHHQNYKNKKFGNYKLLRLKAAAKVLSSREDNTHYAYYGRTHIKLISHEIKYLVKRRIRKYFIDKNFVKKINNNTPFVYYPLQMDEERNSLIGAPFYTNQTELLRHIAKSLPIGYKLYVKEHPSQALRDWRSISEYKEIRDIPNVTLIHPQIPAEELYKKCSLVIAVGGASGFEAAIYQKPSIIFSDFGYSMLPSVEEVKSIVDLPQIIRKSLQKKLDPSDLDRYLIFLENNSFDFDLVGFFLKYQNSFYLGGNLLDNEISTSKMEIFLDNNKLELEKFALEYIKKITQHHQL